MMTLKPTTIQIQQEPGCEDLPIPNYQSSGASGVDLYAAVDEPIELHSGEFKLIPTGIRIAIPGGYEAQVRPRSGLALKNGIGIVNSPGTIDSDYRGIIGVILINFGNETFIIQRGDRIAQMIFCRVEKIIFELRKNLPDSIRNDNGFGSTGYHNAT